MYTTTLQHTPCTHTQNTTHFDSKDDNFTGCRNVSHCQQESYSGLLLPGRSCSTHLFRVAPRLHLVNHQSQSKVGWMGVTAE